MNLVFRCGDAYETRLIIEDMDRVEMIKHIYDQPGVHITDDYLIDFDNYDIFATTVNDWDNYYGDRNRPQGHHPL